MKDVTVSDSDPFSEDDPAYLFRLNQKTRTDLDGVKSTLETLMDGMKKRNEEKRDVDSLSAEWIIPSRAYGIKCDVEGKAGLLRISWKPPLNLDHVSGEEKYEVVVEQVTSSESAGAEFLREASTRETSLELEGLNLRRVRYLKVWVSALVGVGEGGSDGVVRGLETVHRCDLGDVDFG